MLIVPFGKVYLQVDQSQNKAEIYYATLFSELNRIISELVARCLDVNLEGEVDYLLKRELHQRRKQSDETQESRMKCCKCGSHKASDFRRNGHYARGLDTTHGHIQVQMPQIECQCGGGVCVEYKTLKNRQRIWTDLEMEFRSSCGYGMSLRRIKARCDEIIGRSLGLRTLNRSVQAALAGLAIWQESKIGAPPPVIRVDGIWITLMIPTGEEKIDKRGRKRQVKTGKRIPILVAQGVWPASGRQEVIAWVIADAEDQEGWQELIFQLQQKGVLMKDLQLLIADGSSGLEALRLKQFPDIPFQRCIFHKMKNLWRTLENPENLERPQLREYKSKFMGQVAYIWEAQEECEATRRLRTFSQKWQDSQPKAVALLNEGFEQTIAYYRAIDQAAHQGESWPAALLRTTSQLERENRSIRRRMDEAVLFHSEQGLSAYLYLNQVFCQSMRTSLRPGRWSQVIERQIAEAGCFLN